MLVHLDNLHHHLPLSLHGQLQSSTFRSGTYFFEVASVIAFSAWFAVVIFAVILKISTNHLGYCIVVSTMFSVAVSWTMVVILLTALIITYAAVKVSFVMYWCLENVMF